MTWNFRLVKHRQRNLKRMWYGVHEVFYTDKGKPWTMTRDPVTIDGESVKEVLGYLEMIRQDLKRLPALDANKTRWAKYPRDVSRERSKNFETMRELKRWLRRP